MVEQIKGCLLLLLLFYCANPPVNSVRIINPMTEDTLRMKMKVSLRIPVEQSAGIELAHTFSHVLSRAGIVYPDRCRRKVSYDRLVMV